MAELMWGTLVRVVQMLVRKAMAMVMVRRVRRERASRTRRDLKAMARALERGSWICFSTWGMGGLYDEGNDV
jgi:hypothetical protein